MNANQIINMVTRIIMRKMVNGGINAGMNLFSKSKAGGQKSNDDSRPRSAGSPKIGGQGQKQAKQAMRAMRRMSRF